MLGGIQSYDSAAFDYFRSFIFVNNPYSVNLLLFYIFPLYGKRVCTFIYV